MLSPAILWRALGFVLVLALVAGCGPTPPTTTDVSAGTSSTAVPPATAVTSAAEMSTPPPSSATEMSTPSAGGLERRPVVYAIPKMDQVSVRRDLTYKTTAAGDLKMDVYYPADLPTDARLPAVLFVHGGPAMMGGNWQAASWKDSEYYRSWGQLIAASGMIAVTANLPQYDFTALIKHVRGDAAALQIDQDRLCTFGMSHGAGLLVTQAMDGFPDYLRCIVAYYGSGSLSNAWFRVRRGQVEPARIRPILVVAGAKDEHGSGVASEQFAKEATAKGLPVELLIHPSGVHFFDAYNDDDQSRELIKKTIAFLQAHLQAQ